MSMAFFALFTSERDGDNNEWERELVGHKKGFSNVTQSESKTVLFDS